MRDARIARVVVVAIGALLIVAAVAMWAWQHERTIERPPRFEAVGERRGDEAPPPVEANGEGKPNANEATRAAASAPAAAGEQTAAAEAAPSIRGIVVEPTGDPIAGATVQAMDWLGAVAAKTTTDASGAFSFGKLAPDKNHLHAFAPGHLATIVVVGAPDRGYRFQGVTNPARIVLEPGVVAVARLRFTDGSPCAGFAVHLSPAHRSTTGVEQLPLFGPWPPPVTDGDGRVVLDGLPPDRILGLGIDLLGRNVDSPRPFATGSAKSAAAATEQLFVYPKPAKLTVELHGLEAMEASKLEGKLQIWRTDGFHLYEDQPIPPFVVSFRSVFLGGQYGIGLNVPGRKRATLLPRVRITDVDQRLVVDCSLPPTEAASPLEEPRRFLARVVLQHPDHTPITLRDLLDVGLESHSMRVRCGSLSAERRDQPVRTGVVELESGHDEARGLSGRLMVRERPPLWIEGELGPLKSRVEVEQVDESTPIAFTFDLAPLAVGLTCLSFRVRDERGGEVQLASVELTETASGDDSFALPVSPGSISRMVRPGLYHYRCNATDGGRAEGDVEVPAGSPITVDVVLPEAGDIYGTVAPLPDAARIMVTRSPLRGERSRFDWWSGRPVGPDGSYALSGVPPGEWRLMLLVVAPDEASVRVEAATVTVKSNAITRHDFVPSPGSAKRVRVDLGKAERGFVHATNLLGETVFDGECPSRVVLELPVDELRFSATPEIRDENSRNWDFHRWTAGTVTTGADGVAVVRFEFPAH